MNSTLPVMKLMACLLAAVLLPAPAHADETASSPSIEGLSDSKELTTPVVVTGVAVGGDGRPAKSGTLVTLHAWPSEYVMSSLAPGDAVKVVPVGYATTDVNGRFSLRYSNPGGVERAASRDGLVNLEIVSEAEGLVSSHSLVGVAPRIASASPPERRAASEGVHATGGGSLLSVPHVKLAPLPGAVSGVPKGGVSKAVCSTNFVSDLGLANVRVGEFYTIDGAEGRFTYLAGNTSTLGVGASASGAKGSFTAGGNSDDHRHSRAGLQMDQERSVLRVHQVQVREVCDPVLLAGTARLQAVLRAPQRLRGRLDPHHAGVGATSNVLSPARARHQVYRQMGKGSHLQHRCPQFRDRRGGSSGHDRLLEHCC